MATRAIADNVDLRIINSANTSTGAANESRTALGGQTHYTCIYEQVDGCCGGSAATSGVSGALLKALTHLVQSQLLM